MSNDSLLNIDEFPEEKESENTLRPKSFKEFPGQDNVKKKLQIFVAAASQREEPLDHTLLYGPPGLGKTTLAHIIADSLKVPFCATSGPAIRRKGDLAALLTTLQPKSVLFIDEIHRLSSDIEEYLYSAMEDFFIDIVTGEGVGAQSVRFKLSPFTLIGATTRTGLLKAPFRDRFGIIERLEFYDESSLCSIVQRSAQILNLKVTEGGTQEISKRSRGTPRIVNRLLKRIRDYAQIQKKEVIDEHLASYALKELGVNKYGLHGMDMQILKILQENFLDRAVGIDTLSATINEEVDTIEDFYEPYLLRQGLIQKTPRGRILTKKGKEIVASIFPDSVEKKKKKQEKLF